jgi:Ca-activated chloride channel homolog
VIDLEFKSEKCGTVVGQENTLDVLLRASSDNQRPEIKRRLPLNLSLVLDRSGSMDGRPLKEAKNCANMLVERLNADDRLSVITYDDRVDVLSPTTNVTSKDRLKRQISRIRSGGMTALYDGWSVGAEQVALYADKNYLSRVLLLSDGQANQGETDEVIISNRCQSMAEQGVTTSTYGLSEHFNEALMLAMAKNGQGQAHYGQTADDLLDPFQQEFDLMEAILGHRLRLRIMPEPSVKFTLSNGYAQDQEGRFILPDLAYEADVWALLKVTINKNVCDGTIGTWIKLLTATVDYLDREGNENRTKPAVLGIELMTDEAYAALPVEETVRQRSIEVRAATLQEQAQTAAQKGQWEIVDRIMTELETLGTDNAWIKESISRLRAYSSRRQAEAFSKEASYKANNMRTRSTSREESYNAFYEPEERSMPSYLRRKSEQGKKRL